MDDALHVGGVDSADADGLRILALSASFIEVTQNLPDSIHADDLFGVLLGLSSVECTNTQVVGTSLDGYPSFFDGRDRSTNDFIFSQETTCLSYVHVILADVYAFATYSQCDIDSVVNQKRDFVLFTLFVQLLGCRNEVTSVAGLVSVLDDGDTLIRGQ